MEKSVNTNCNTMHFISYGAISELKHKVNLPILSCEIPSTALSARVKCLHLHIEGNSDILGKNTCYFF